MTCILRQGKNGKTEVKMNFTFEQKSIGETTCLVLKLDDNLAIDTFAVNMLTHNHIQHIVPVQIVQMDEKKYAQFNITGLAKLGDRVAAARPKKEVLSIFSSILNAFEEADAYMLDAECLFLQWEYVYLDGRGNCMFFYLPFSRGAGRDRIDFLREVVNRIRPDYQEKDPYLYDILNAFGRGAVQKLSDFRELIKKSANSLPDGPRADEEKKSGETQGAVQAQIDGGADRQEIGREPQEKGRKAVLKTVEKQPDHKLAAGAKIPVINIPGREPGEKIAVPKTEPKKKKEQKNPKVKREEEKRGFFKRSGENIKVSVLSKKQKPDKIPVPKTGNEMPELSGDRAHFAKNREDDRSNGMYESYDATVFMQAPPEREEDGDGTVLLPEPEYAGQTRARLVQIQGGITYWVQNDRMTIGSGAAADIHIDNPTVSRSHAVIVRIEGRYYLEDSHSKNGSFVEGRRLQPGRREAVYDGMTLKFANEEFEFDET